MSGDYKYEMQVIAEEIAQECYGKDFYELTPHQQFTTFSEAEGRWVDRISARTDDDTYDRG
jgi:hypothetical protein